MIVTVLIVVVQLAVKSEKKESNRLTHTSNHRQHYSKQNYFHFQFIGIITFLLGVCNELFSPASTKKSKKKIQHSPDELKTSELLNKLNETVQNSISFLENILDEWPQYEFKADIEETLATLSLEQEEKYQSPVENKLKNGRQDMLTDVGNILKRKSKYLKSLVQ